MSPDTFQKSHSLQEQPCQSYTLLWLLSPTPGISSVQCYKALPLPDSVQISLLFSLLLFLFINENPIITAMTIIIIENIV